MNPKLLLFLYAINSEFKNHAINLAIHTNIYVYIYMGRIEFIQAEYV